MPRAPRLSPARLIRVLEKLGFREHSERGTSHLVFSHPDGRRTLVARPRNFFERIARPTLVVCIFCAYTKTDFSLYLLRSSVSLVSFCTHSRQHSSVLECAYAFLYQNTFPLDGRLFAQSTNRSYIVSISHFRLCPSGVRQLAD